MASDIYNDAIADAKTIRTKAHAAAERHLVEAFTPKIEKYIERALLEAAGESTSSDDDDNDILLGVDTPGSDEDKSDVADDVAASIENGDMSDNDAGISVNHDGTVTLELDKMVLPDGLDDSDASMQHGPDAGELDFDALLSGDGDGNDEPDMSDEDKTDVVADGIQYESINKIKQMLKLVEHTKNQKTKLYAFCKIAEQSRNAHKNLTRRHINSKSATALTMLGECVRTAYSKTKNTLVVENNKKNALLSHFETTYSHVNKSLVAEIHNRVLQKINECDRKIKRTKGSDKKNVVKQLKELRSVIDTITDATNIRRSKKLKNRIVKLMKEATKSRSRQRSNLREEDVTLRISLPDDETSDKVRDLFDGEGVEDDEDMDDDEADDSEEDEADDAEDDEKETTDEAVARSIAHLFEADEGDETDEDMQDEDEEVFDMEMDGDDMSDEDMDDDSMSAQPVGVLNRVADVLADEDVQVELIDDTGDMSDDDMSMDMDDGSDVIDIVDDEDDEMDDMDESDCMDEGDEMVDVDMSEVARAIREMKTSRGRQNVRATRRPGRSDTARGRVVRNSRLQTENKNNFVGRVARSTNADSRVMMSRKTKKHLVESVRPESASNLLQMKLLHANKILQRSDLTPIQRKRVMRAIDEAKSSKEVKVLYTRLTNALNERRSVDANKRHRSTGTSSRVLTSSGIRSSTVNEGFGGTENSNVFTESIDLGAWKRHAGIADD